MAEQGRIALCWSGESIATLTQDKGKLDHTVGRVSKARQAPRQKVAEAQLGLLETQGNSAERWIASQRDIVSAADVDLGARMKGSSSSTRW